MKDAARTVLLFAIIAACLTGQTKDNASGVTKGMLPTSTILTMTGLVMVDDGSPLPDSATIQLICSGYEHTVAHTNATGDFGFQWAASSDALATATSTTPGLNVFTDSNGDARTRGVGVLQGNNCELGAELPGYSSRHLSFRTPAAFDGHDVGVILLHRMTAPGRAMVSLSTLKAPKNADRDFNKGIELLMAGKLAEAAARFNKAVAAYPDFAEAWMLLGTTQYHMRLNEAADGSLKRATALDPKIAGAWRGLGYMAYDRKDWENAASYLDKAERLEPLTGLPWLLSAVAYYQMGRLDEAYRSIRAEIKLDPQFRFRRAEYVLGLILVARHDTEGGAAMLRDYLASSPNSVDVDSVKAILRRLD